MPLWLITGKNGHGNFKMLVFKEKLSLLFKEQLILIVVGGEFLFDNISQFNLFFFINFYPFGNPEI